MLVELLGWLWLIVGVTFLIRPQFLKAKLEKKSLKAIRKVLFGIALFLGLWLLVAGLKSEGFLAKLLMILGIIALIKAALLLKSKIMERAIQWFSRQPLNFFRLCACSHIAIGAIIILS